MKPLVRFLCNTDKQIPKTEEVKIMNIDEIGGKSNIFTYHSGIDDPQKAKVEEYFEKSVVKYKPPKAKPKAN
ncbi:hypothetical protein BY996DRAFT_6475070 [Phakopsora pachyrhizi]|uniref:Uncharacterized protein n=1 Tax=Phakopsora pachyrhizi TaxID=170000 RepID=A0AAV0AMF0_PHAPC|nr:hypothetical protein BY996DRAFT_6475070 [Phakopsora pachyrhizi]CAH7669152.1 hypothetical protein PPACK8108_LOCUS3719 [Phakopsora pachyrhizi]